ncbi:MAG: hypothetical protein KIT84_12375 [Labilithrix sp.]|nr:hypothetical protein [Labilithrix sp.]MCW5811809.1 hypothetical protein [Labilithrix sp.]
MPTYLYRIEPTRLGMPTDPTPEEQSAVAAHFAYLKAAYDSGVVRYVGRTLDAPHLGLAVLEAADQDAATAFLTGDPAVEKGIFAGRVQPFSEVLPMRSR